MVDAVALLRVLRRRTGRNSKSEVAVASGINPNLLSAWAKGSYAPTGRQLARIAGKFHITLDALITEVNAEARGDSTPAAALPPPMSDGQQDEAITRALHVLKSNGRLDLIEHLRNQGAYLSTLVEGQAKLVGEMRRLQDRLTELETRVMPRAPTRNADRGQRTPPSAVPARRGRRRKAG